MITSEVWMMLCVFADSVGSQVENCLSSIPPTGLICLPLLLIDVNSILSINCNVMHFVRQHSLVLMLGWNGTWKWTHHCEDFDALINKIMYYEKTNLVWFVDVSHVMHCTDLKGILYFSAESYVTKCYIIIRLSCHLKVRWNQNFALLEIIAINFVKFHTL